MGEGFNDDAEAKTSRAFRYAHNIVCTAEVPVFVDAFNEEADDAEDADVIL